MRVESDVRTPARAGCHGDRVAVVLRAACGWEHDERVGRRAVVELDDRRAGRRAPEDGAVHLAREERVERALARDGRSSARNGEADCARAGVALERERLDDANGRGDGRGHDERDEDRCEAARHGCSLAQHLRWRSLWP